MLEEGDADRCGRKEDYAIMIRIVGFISTCCAMQNPVYTVKNTWSKSVSFEC
jgi:hypothetical protein